MSWIFNCCIKYKIIFDCEVSIQIAEDEDVKSFQRHRGWYSFFEPVVNGMDRMVSSIAVPFFVSLRNYFDYTLRRSPDLAVAPLFPNSYLTEHPKVMRAVLVQHRNNPERGLFSTAGKVIEPTMNLMKSMYSSIEPKDIILTCGPEESARYRYLLKVFFSEKEIHNHMDSIEEMIEMTFKKWVKHPEPFVINKDIKLLATGIMGKIFLGHPGPYDQISEASSKIILWLTHNIISTKSRFYTALIKFFPKLALISSIDRKKTTDYMLDAVNRALKEASQPNAKPSLVKSMLEREFSTEQMYAMIITLFVAGQDNLSTSLTYAIFKLAQDEQLQRNIRNEATGAMDSKYIRALLCEGLRFMCPINGIGRVLAKPAILTMKSNDDSDASSSTLLKQGDRIIPAPFAAALNPALYPTPERFDYTRHLERKPFLPELPHLPFGHGAHLCPGWYLYYVISAHTISDLVTNFKLSTPFKGEPRLNSGFITGLADDIPIKLEKLN